MPALTCVRPEMRLQVGALGVSLPTAGESAGVCRSPLPWPRPATPLGFGIDHFEWGGRWGEQDPLAGRRLLREAHSRVISEHIGELVMAVRPGERELHPVVWERESPWPTVSVVESLGERQRGGAACLGLVALGAPWVIWAEWWRHAPHGDLRGTRQPRLLLV